MSKPFTTRVDDDLVERLTRRSVESELSRGRLAERYIDEGLRMDAHPGIVFRDGPAGRRAGLAGGLDVWQAISIVLDQEERGEAAAEAAAEYLGVPLRTMQIAISYYGEYRDEIDSWIQRNHEAADLAESAWRAGVDAIS